MENNYYDKDRIAKAIKAGQHRTVIGGKWDEVGPWQFEYMRAQGLGPDQSLIDIGCGSLRGGVHFIDYLAAHKYYGFDINYPLITAGLEHEISAETRAAKIDMDNFAGAENFAYPDHWRNIDAALSISLFSHLNFNSIKECLLQTWKVLRPGAIYYTTLFCVDRAELLKPVSQFKNIDSHFHKDPFHYSYEDVWFMAESTGYDLLDVKDCGHARNLKMARLQRRELWV